MADSPAALKQIEADLRDRFGKFGDEVRALLLVTEIRIRAEQKGIVSVETESSRLKCLRNSGRRDDWVQVGTRFPRLTAPKPLLRLKEIISFLNNLPNPCRLHRMHRSPSVLRCVSPRFWRSRFRPAPASSDGDDLNLRFANGIVAIAEDKIITVADVCREIAPLVGQLRRDARSEREFNEKLEQLQDEVIQSLDRPRVDREGIPEGREEADSASAYVDERDRR